jgi:hypothetical protein
VRWRPIVTWRWIAASSRGASDAGTTDASG